MSTPPLQRSVQILLFIIGSIAALYFGKPFLVPLAFAALIAMLLQPLATWFTKKGLNRTVSILLSIVLLLAGIAGIISLLVWQLSSLAKDAAGIEGQLMQKVTGIQQWLSTALGIPVDKQQEILKKQQSSGGGLGSVIPQILAGVGSFLTNFILVIIYTFLLMYLRPQFKAFIMRLVPHEARPRWQDILHKSAGVGAKYLGGMGMMIVCLWVMYGIGFSIAGVKNAIFFAMLCGLLEIIPFVGNLAGTGFTMLMSMAQGGSTTQLLGIGITYALVQSIQSYLLEPLVVGDKVSINPFVTIAGIVAGELVWGIPGMMLAVPLLGILKIVCDGVPILQPWGYFLGAGKMEGSKEAAQETA